MAENTSQKHDSNNSEVNLVEVANYLFSHKTYIGVAAFAAASIMGVWTFFFSTPLYTSATTILYEHGAQTTLDQENNVYWIEQAQIENKLFVMSILFNSEKFRKNIGAEIYDKEVDQITHNETEFFKKIIRSYVESRGLTKPEDIGNFLAKDLSLSIEPVKRLIYITGQSSSPILAQALTRVASQTFIKMNFEKILKETNSVLKFIENQTEITRMRLYGLEDELALLQKNKKVLSVDHTSNSVDALQVDNEMAFYNLKIEKDLTDMWIKSIEDSIQQFRSAIVSGSDSHLYLLQLQKRMDYLLYQRNVSKEVRDIASVGEKEAVDSLNQVITEFQSSFEKIRQSNLTSDPWAYLKTLELNLAKAKEKQIETAAKINARKRVTAVTEKKYTNLPQVLKSITQLKRNIEITGGLYQQLKSKLQETQILKSGKSNELSILQPSSYPESTVGLKMWKKFIFAFVGGAFVIIMLLSVRFVLLPTIRSRNDLRKLSIEVLAEIPFVRSADEHDVNTDYPLLLNGKATTNEANSVRQARFNIEEKLQLHATRDTAGAKILTICSSNSREGKSFIAANLAHAFSIAQYRVLLLDLDVLNSTLRKYFSVEHQFNENKNNENQDFYFDNHILSEFLNLVDIPSTKTSITDILETPLLNDMLVSMKSKYDIIFIDTPPIRNSLEPLIASRYSDGIIFVANQRRTLRYDVYKSLDTLRESYKGRIFSILNFSYDEVSVSYRRVAS